MKRKHDGDCSIYASLINGNPEDGICTCGYGRDQIINGKYSELYSKERKEESRRQRESELESPSE